MSVRRAVGSALVIATGVLILYVLFSRRGYTVYPVSSTPEGGLHSEWSQPQSKDDPRYTSLNETSVSSSPSPRPRKTTPTLNSKISTIRKAGGMHGIFSISTSASSITIAPSSKTGLTTTSKTPALLFNLTTRDLTCSDWIHSCRQECKNEEGQVPRLVYFIKYDATFRMDEWLAVLSAHKHISPDRIIVFSKGDMSGCWWKRTLPLVEHYVVPDGGWVEKLNSKKLTYPAHKSDFLRMALLYHLGGIYIDTDAIATKSFDSLLHKQVVLAEQSGHFAACGLMVARKQSCFMCDFMHTACQRFNGGWATHSIEVLIDFKRRLHTYPGAVLLEWSQGFFPFGWEGVEIQRLYEDSEWRGREFDLTQVYALHLFNSATYLAHSTVAKRHLEDYSWITGSKSPAAKAIRAILPKTFTKSHLKVSEGNCVELQYTDG